MVSRSLTVLALLLPGFCLSSCSRAPEEISANHGSTELLLYCGAGIRPAAKALIDEFEAAHDIKVSATYAGSGRLLGQLTTSRRGDLFMPGSAFYVNKAIEDGLADGVAKRKVALFIPTILVQKGNPLGVESLRNFADRQLRVGLGDERAVAVGKRSVKLFEKNGIPYDEVMKNVVYRSGTVNELGVAIEMRNIDAAIVWDANARQFADVGDAIEIPREENIVSTIPIAPLTFSRERAAALKFIDFVTSDKGKAILRKQGYMVE